MLSCWWIRSSYKLYNTNEVICKESSRYKSEIYQRFPTPNLVDREHCVVWIRVELLDSNKFRSAFWFSFRCILLPFLQRITNEDSSPTLHRASSVIGNSLVVHVATRALFSKQLAVTNMRPSSNTSSSANRTASQDPRRTTSQYSTGSLQYLSVLAVLLRTPLPSDKTPAKENQSHSRMR